MDFFSMGMFCVDEIHTPKQSYQNIIGGAGTYATLGAGVNIPKVERRRVGFICDEGNDFSPDMKAEIDRWATGTIFRRDTSRQTTKAWNKFVDNEERLFKYLSPKRQIFYEDLPPVAREAKGVHFICSPQRCEEFMSMFRSSGVPNQKYIWEPVPTECRPAQFGALKRVVVDYNVSILSPNALEAAALVGLAEPSTKADVEKMDDEHYKFAPIIAIRCGAMGCYLRVGEAKKWYPAYFEGHPERVIDPSGAGNAFTGALCEAFAKSLDWDTVMAHAAVGASFMIEQVGTPHYDPSSDTWNGSSGPERVSCYLGRIRGPKDVTSP